MKLSGVVVCAASLFVSGSGFGQSVNRFPVSQVASTGQPASVGRPAAAVVPSIGEPRDERGDSLVAAFIDDYRRGLVAWAIWARDIGDAANPDLSDPARESVRKARALKFRHSLVDVIEADPLNAVEILIGISPYITLDFPVRALGAPPNFTLHFLLRSPNMPWIEKQARELTVPGEENPRQSVMDLTEFMEPTSPRVAAFRAISREEVYRRVIARLPEVGQEKMFGVLVAMFRFDPWLAATTIDELAETGELPVNRPADAKPTRAHVLKNWIDASTAPAMSSGAWAWQGVYGIGPLLPSALEMAGERWWIRAALAREIRLDAMLKDSPDELLPAAYRLGAQSPLLAARRALVDDPHPLVRYTVFGQVARNSYEDSLKRYREIDRSAAQPGPDSPGRYARIEAAEQQARRESRLGKPITEIPEPPKE